VRRTIRNIHPRILDIIRDPYILAGIERTRELELDVFVLDFVYRRCCFNVSPFPRSEPTTTYSQYIPNWSISFAAS
jgi:hypothetical protein